MPALCVGDEEVSENLDARDRLEFLGIDEIGVHRERVGLAKKLDQAAVFFDQIVRKHRNPQTTLTRAQYAKHVGDGQMWRTRTFTLAADIEQPPPVLQMRGNGAAAEQNDTMLVEIVMRARRAEALEIVRRRVSVRMHREQLALDQVRLGWLAQANRNVGLAHRQIQFFIRRAQGDVDVGVKVEEFAEPVPTREQTR